MFLAFGIAFEFPILLLFLQFRNFIEVLIILLSIPFALIGGFATASAALLIVVASVLLKGRKRPVVSGIEEMIGSAGEVLVDFDDEGLARVHSEIWRVRSRAPLKAGQRVRVAAMHGLLLDVVPDPDKGT